MLGISSHLSALLSPKLPRRKLFVGEPSQSSLLLFVFLWRFFPSFFSCSCFFVVFVYHPLPYMKYLRLISIFTYEYTGGKFWWKNEDSIPPRETTRARPGSPPAGSGETSMVRHVEQAPHTPNGEPHLELKRLRLNRLLRHGQCDVEYIE